MREIREKLRELITAYEEQLKLYKQIGEVGSEEQQLISEGNLDSLLQVLKDKEDLLKRAGQYEQHIRSGQEQLVRHFGVETFSLPQLKLAAPPYYQAELLVLEAVVAQLVPVLEALEDQERRNEAALSRYLDQGQKSQRKTSQIRRAGRAYGKRKS